jgi:hypothetical protein
MQRSGCNLRGPAGKRGGGPSPPCRTVCPRCARLVRSRSANAKLYWTSRSQLFDSEERVREHWWIGRKSRGALVYRRSDSCASPSEGITPDQLLSVGQRAAFDVSYRIRRAKRRSGSGFYGKPRRHGPLRKNVVLRFWQQPAAWLGFFKSYLKARRAARDRAACLLSRRLVLLVRRKAAIVLLAVGLLSSVQVQGLSHFFGHVARVGLPRLD